MSGRQKPSEMTILKVITTTECGEILEEQSEPTLLDTWSPHMYRGRKILDIPSRKWLAKGWLPQDSLIVVYAPAGLGKSFYAHALALEMARGGPWVGYQLKPANVLYIAAERGTELRDRSEAWEQHHECLLPDSFLLLDVPRPPQLTNSSQVSALCELIERESITFVVLDTYARMTEGIDENSSKDTGEMIGCLDQIHKATKGGIVLIVHHTGKNAQAGLRGSSAFLGAVDMTIELSGGAPNIKANVVKSNAGAAPIPEWYKITPIELPALEGEWGTRSVAVLVHTGAPATNPAVEAKVIEIFEEYAPNSISTKELLEALTEAGVEMKPTTFKQTILKPLKDRGLITLTGSTNRAKWSLVQD